jgi:hypothetical protein
MDLGGGAALGSRAGVAQTNLDHGRLQEKGKTVSGPTSFNLEAALAYARRGWPVFPLHSAQEGQCSCRRSGCSSIGKHPRTAHGLKDATVDDACIRAWWAQWPDANVGIVTGSPSRLVVLDVDPRHGGDESLTELERQHGKLPETVESLTGGGGRHLLFQHPGGLITSKPLASGLDIKADGGYIVAPPSSHASGEPYRWEISSHPEDMPLAALPSWLAEFTAQPIRSGPSTQGADREESKTIRQGERNTTLTRLAGAMRRQGTNEEVIRQALAIENQARCVPPLPEDEVEKIAASVARYAPQPIATTRPRDQKAEEKGGEKPPQKSQASLLIQLCDESEALLFHDQFQEAYAWVPLQKRREALKIRSRRFRDWLAHRLWQAERKAPPGEALQSALNILAARALFEGPQHHLWNRVARHDGAIWYDLGEATIRITSSGWERVQDPPLLFVRYSHQRPQTIPVTGGDLRAVLAFVNIPDGEDPLSSSALLFLAHLVLMLVPDIPHPVLCVHAEQGSGKTTLFKLIRDLIDPSATPTLGPQDNIREFVQLAAHQWVVFLDNLTTLPDWLSDAICRCVTGEGFSKRELYSDDDDMLYSFRRCLGLNGINLVPANPDLLDRVLIFPLERIAEVKRRTETEFWEAFHTAKPQLLGALLTVLSQAMSLVPHVTGLCYPRLADFARWGIAVAQALGQPDDAFLQALAQNTRSQTTEALQASPVAQVLLAFLEGEGNWSGTPTELLKELNEAAADAGVDTKSRAWPKDARWVWRRIKEVRPNLAAVGWQVVHGEAHGKPVITITRIARENDPSVPSDPNPQAPGPVQAGIMFDDEADSVTSVGDRKPSENGAFSDTGDTGNSFPDLSGAEASGWPAEIPGLGTLRRDVLTPCEHCATLTSFCYGGRPLCARHARARLTGKRPEGSD